MKQFFPIPNYEPQYKSIISKYVNLTPSGFKQEDFETGHKELLEDEKYYQQFLNSFLFWKSQVPKIQFSTASEYGLKQCLKKSYYTQRAPFIACGIHHGFKIKTVFTTPWSEYGKTYFNIRSKQVKDAWNNISRETELLG